MKLIAKVVECFAAPNGKFLVLHDENGVQLPAQIAVELEQEMGECPILTVRFRIDGDELRLE